jgi:3-dehydroquinate synthase
VLNFGHTIGHGIEANCEGKLYHGECVAIGMLPMCSDSLRARLSAVLEKYNLPTSCDIDAAKISEAVLHDKKSNGDSITAVCADEPGKFRFISMKPDDFREKINSITENRK